MKDANNNLENDIGVLENHIQEQYDEMTTERRHKVYKVAIEVLREDNTMSIPIGGLCRFLEIALNRLGYTIPYSPYSLKGMALFPEINKHKPLNDRLRYWFKLKDQKKRLNILLQAVKDTNTGINIIKHK